MALVARPFTFATGTGTGNLTRVEPDGFAGITPKAALFWTVGRGDAVDAVGGATHRRSIGFATGTADRRACGSYSLDAALASNAGRAHRDDAVIVTLTDSGADAALDGLLDISEWGAGGFTPAVDDAFAADTRIGGILLGGSDITRAGIISFQEPTGAGDQDTQTLSFSDDAPTHIFLISVGNGSAPPVTDSSQGGLIFGVSDATKNYVWAGAALDNQATMITKCYCRSGECFANLNAASNVTNARATCTAMLANGFRLNWIERSSTRYVFALALRIPGGLVELFDLLTRTDGNDIVVTATGLGTPVGGLVVSHAFAQNAADTLADHDRLSIGAFSSPTDRHAMAMLDEHNTADAEVATAIEYDAVYANIATDDTLVGAMDVKAGGVIEDQVTFVMDDTDPAAAFGWGVLFGSAAAESPSGSPRRLHIHPVPLTADV